MYLSLYGLRSHVMLGADDTSKVVSGTLDGLFNRYFEAMETYA